MSEIKNTLKISAPLSPYDSTDVYPTHLPEYGKGGLRTVESIEDRDNIPVERRDEGMFVYVKENKTTYALRDGLENTNWIELESFLGGADSGQIKITDNESPENPTKVTLWFNQGEGNFYSRDPENTKWIQYVPPLIDGGTF